MGGLQSCIKNTEKSAHTKKKYLPFKLNSSSVPNELLLEVFLKMDNATVSRMRRICKFMNSFVEFYKKKLSARPDVGLRLGISHWHDYFQQPCILSVRITANVTTAYRRAFKIDSEVLEKLSAVSVRTLCVMSDDNRRRIEGNQQYGEMKDKEMLSTVRDLLNIAHRIRFVDYPVDFIVELLPSINSSRVISIELGHFYKLIDITNDLEILAKSEQSKKLWVHIDDHPINALIFACIKEFYGFTIRKQPKDFFYHFISHIYYSKTAGNLKLVIFNYQDEEFNFETDIRSKPAYETLWDVDLIPESRLARIKTPKLIHKMDLKSKQKCAIIAHYKFPGNIYLIFVINNQPENVFDCVIKNLGISSFASNLREEFLNRREKSAQGIFRNIYLNNDYYKVPLDCLSEVDDDFSF